MYDTARLSRALLLAVVLVGIQCKPPQQNIVLPVFDMQGHRGCRGLMPENTIPAMVRALQLGVTTLEMDAVISKDQQVVVSHEPFFGWEISTSPEGNTIMPKDEKQYNLYQMDYQEIQRWGVGLKPHLRFPRQERIKVAKPLLANLIDSVEQYIALNRLPLVQYNIETKSMPSTDNIFHPSPEPFTDLLMSVIMKKKIERRTIIQSFDVRTLQVMHRKYPGVRTALLVEGFNKNTAQENLVSLGFTPSIYSPEYSLVNPELVTWCHKNGMKIIPWTVNDKNNIDRLKAMGVDGIISDYPDLFRQ